MGGWTEQMNLIITSLSFSVGDDSSQSNRDKHVSLLKSSPLFSIFLEVSPIKHRFQKAKLHRCVAQRAITLVWKCSSTCWRRDCCQLRCVQFRDKGRQSGVLLEAEVVKCNLGFPAVWEEWKLAFIFAQSWCYWSTIVIIHMSWRLVHVMRMI